MTDEIWIATDAAGYVTDCSPAALDLTGYTARGVRGRNLTTMFVRERPTASELIAAAHGSVIEREASFRPCERKALRVRFRVTRLEPQTNDPASLRWTFSLRWPVGMRIPAGVDRRQVITVWRAESLRCVFVPGGAHNRRLLLCGHDDEVIHEEPAGSGAAAFARAAELRSQFASNPGNLPQ